MTNKYDQAEKPRNTSGIRPKGHAILAEPFEEKKEGSLIVLPPPVKERTQMLQDKCTVVEIGAACWIDEPERRCEVGDLILIPYMAGRMVGADQTKDGKAYRVINDRDVIAEIER